MSESFISIQANISKAFIQKTIEAQLKNELGSNGLSIDLPQGNLLIENVDNVQYEVTNQDVLLAADIEVEYSKEEGINLIGQATIHLVICMAYKIKPDFTFYTETSLKEYNWIEKPSLKIGKIKIPSKTALDVLIKSFDQKFGKQIDELIASKIDLQKIVTEQLAKFENPIPNAYDPNIHLSIRPVNLLFHIAEQGGHYGLTGHTSFQAEVNWENRPIEKIFSALPHVQEYDGKPTPSEVNVPVKVDYKLLAEMLGKQFAKVKVMEEDLEVSDLQVNYKNDLLHVGANIKGSISGKLNAKFLPRLDPGTQKMYLDRLDYEIISSSFLVKAAVFLFKGKIDKRLEQFSIIDLNLICDKMVKDFNAKIKDIALEGLTFNFKMDKIELIDLSLFENHFISHIKVKADGQLM